MKHMYDTKDNLIFKFIPDHKDNIDENVYTNLREAKNRVLSNLNTQLLEIQQKILETKLLTPETVLEIQNPFR